MHHISFSLFLSFIVFCMQGFSQNSPILPFAESKFALIEQQNIHYRQWQPKQETKGKILLIHGFCGSTFCWRNNISSLTDAGFEVIAVDLPPFGYSKKSRKSNYSASANAAKCWELLNQIDPNYKEWYLTGHSMGGDVIALMACKNPEKVKGLIFVDGLVGQMPKVSRFQQLAFNNVLIKGLANAAGKVYFFKYKRIEKLLTSAYAQKPDSVAVMGYLNPLKQKGCAGGIFQMFAAKDIFTVDLAQMPQNALVIWGEKDSWLHLGSMKKALKRLSFSPAVHIIEGAGHCPMETHSAEVNPFIISFLNK